jgi:phospholipid/cholesterol/gamma-HCH transport system substrate-binding protein
VTEAPVRKPFAVITIVFTGVIVLAVFTAARLNHHSRELRSYLQTADGLQAGASVRLAGVEIGRVKSVRVRPEHRPYPVELLMNIHTPYELNIPRDSVVSLNTAGVLGATFVEIDTRKASGPPVPNDGELQSAATTTLTEQVLEKLGDALAKRPCEDVARKDVSRQKSATKP